MASRKVDGWELIGVSEGPRYLFTSGRGKSARGLILHRGIATDIGSPQAALSRLVWGRPSSRQRASGNASLMKATLPSGQRLQGV